jgi:hypothetical protein
MTDLRERITDNSVGKDSSHQEILIHLKRSDWLKCQNSAMHLHAASKSENSVRGRAAPARDCSLRQKRKLFAFSDPRWEGRMLQVAAFQGNGKRQRGADFKETWWM